MKPLSATLALLVAGLLAACGGSVAAGADDSAVCPPPDIEMPGAVDIVARCERVIAAADERLGLLHWPVSNVQVRWSLCPPGARCMFLQLRQAWVIYRFWAGDPVMIHVGPRLEGVGIADDFFADSPEPLPDWLLQELEVDEGRGPKG